MTANLSTLFNAGSLYEQLIGQVLQIESQPRLKLRAEQSEEKIYKGVLSDFDSRVSALHSRFESFADPLRNPFAAQSARVGEEGTFTARATDDAAPGQYQVRVDRLARADTRVSTQRATDGTALSSSLGTQSRTLTVGIAQPDGSVVDLDVDFAPAEGATDEEVLQSLATAINDAVESATEAGDLAEGTGAQAALIREGAGTVRLSVKSLATGYGNKLSFSGDADLLQALEIGNENVRQGTGGGAIYAVGADAASSSLSASFELDGLQIYRDTNTISDAIEGLTFELLEAGAETSLTVGADTKGMRAEIDGFLKEYNALIGFLNQKSAVDADTGARGVFSGDAAMNALRFGLRSDVGLPLDAGGAIASLADLGIEAERDGTLKIKDEAALTAALSSSPDAVSELFRGEGGLASRVTSRLGALIGAEGTIAERERATEDRIQRIEGQIERWDARLDAREKSLRAQFQQLEQVLAQVQSQSSSLAFYSNSIYGYGY